MRNLDLAADSRSYNLRGMYWNGEHEKCRLSKVLEGSGEPTLVGRARDFATLLEETPPVVQPLDRIAGVALVDPAEGSSIQRL